MTGATFRITHQNPANYVDMKTAFDISDSEEYNDAQGTGYKEIYFARESNTGKVYLAIKGNLYCEMAMLDEGAKRILREFLSDDFK